MGGVPVGRLAAAVQPVYAKLGIRTGKQREQFLPQPIGEVLAAALCGLANSGLKIRDVRQGEDGCHFGAILPSDIFSFAGDVLIDVTKQGTGARLVVATNVPGQLYDWGKSDRCLDRFLREMMLSLGDKTGEATRAA